MKWNWEMVISVYQMATGTPNICCSVLRSFVQANTT